MELTKKEKEFFEKYFSTYETKHDIELEDWTNGGVDMLIYLDKETNETATTQFKNFIDNFDIDDEIDIHRQNKLYRDNFSIRESLKDFQEWLNWLKHIYKELV